MSNKNHVNLIANNILTLFFSVLMVLTTVTSLFAQNDPRLEIVLKVDPEVLRFSEGKTQGTIQDLAVLSPGIAAVFNRRNVDTIRRVFPNFKPEDRFKVIRTGETVTLSDRSNIHILRVRNLNAVDPLIEELSEIPQPV